MFKELAGKLGTVGGNPVVAPCPPDTLVRIMYMNEAVEPLVLPARDVDWSMMGSVLHFQIVG